MERFSRQPAQQQTQPAAPQPAAPTAPAAATKSTWQAPTLSSKVLVVSLIVVAIIITVVLGLSALGSLSSSSLVKTEQYQAIFLDNGQVYFGRLDDVNRDYVRLTDIYYLQVEQQIQPDQQTDDAAAVDDQQTRISLAKLGNELHGPEDEMFILRSKITFWENLKDDGQVTKAISEHVQNGGQAQDATQTETVN
jgi:hypothetical protein